MQQFSSVSVSQVDRVMEVRLNRPDVKNAIDSDIMLALCEIFENVCVTQTRVIVITANGPDFSSGADLNWMRSLASNSARSDLQSQLLVRMYTALYHSPVPTVARVFGRVFAGGIGIISTCDAVLAADNSEFRMSEVRVGLAPIVMAPFVIEKVGTARFRELSISGRCFDVNEAQRIGLVDHILPLIGSDVAFQSYVARIVRGAPGAISCTKALCRELAPLRWEEMSQRLAAILDQRRGTSEAKEGIEAFFDERLPHWVDCRGDKQTV